MAKKDNRELKSTPEIEKIADRIRTARKEAKRWKEYESAQVEEFKALTEGEIDVNYLTDAGDEVISISETEPSISYDYKAFFAAHPEHKAELEEKFAKEGRSQIRVTTNWVAQN